MSKIISKKEICPPPPQFPKPPPPPENVFPLVPQRNKTSFGGPKGKKLSLGHQVERIYITLLLGYFSGFEENVLPFIQQPL